MDTKDLVQKLKDIKKEISALKQSHLYGVGLADFNYYFVDIERDEGRDEDIVRVELVYNTTTMPMFYFMNNINLYYPRISWDSQTKTLTIERERVDIAKSYIVSTTPAISFSYEVLP